MPSAIRSARVHDGEVLAGKLRQAERVREEVVHERHARERELPGEKGRIHDPGQVRGLAAPVVHGAGDAEAGGVNAPAREKRLDGPLESRDLAAPELLLVLSHEPARLDLEERETHVRAADVAREDHRSAGAEVFGRGRFFERERAAESARITRVPSGLSRAAGSASS